jgi:hypothetical protein
VDSTDPAFVGALARPLDRDSPKPRRAVGSAGGSFWVVGTGLLGGGHRPVLCSAARPAPMGIGGAGRGAAGALLNPAGRDVGYSEFAGTIFRELRVCERSEPEPSNGADRSRVALTGAMV